MSKQIFNLLLLSACCATAEPLRTSSTFAGVLLSGHNEGFAAGNIALTVSGGQVSFQSTLFQPYVTGTTLEPVLVTQRKVIPFSLGTGTPGSFRDEEFLGPIPGMGTQAPCGGFSVIDPGFIIDPGFLVPVYSDGTRFTGSFKAFPSLEHLLLAEGGTVYLQIHGAPFSLDNPIFTAPLQHVIPPSTNLFTATFAGSNEVPRNGSPYHGTGSFTLTGNCLGFSLAMDLGFAWSSAGICGPASYHSTSTNLVLDFGPVFGVVFPAQPGVTGQVVYNGSASLNEEQVDQLKRGKLSVNFLSGQYPNGEICGPILPLRPSHEKRER